MQMDQLFVVMEKLKLETFQRRINMNQCLSTNETSTQCARPLKNPTVEEYFDGQIQLARQRVEELCIKKAKLEALGMLDYTHNDLMVLLNSYPF